jgi:membrane-bound lytic murein transglycosylase D
MRSTLLSFVVICSLLPSCASRRPLSGEDSEILALSEENEEEAPAEEVSAATSKEFNQPRSLLLRRQRRSRSNVNAALHVYEKDPLVQQWIQYFSKEHKETFDNFMHRGSVYRRTIEKILRNHDIPEFLYYLAMIESGFSPTIRSSAQAVGVWQFIEGTAKRYDLAISSYVDERRDPVRSTIAAAKYLKDLHNVFQSWFLAMAAYNCGESRVMNAIMNTDSRNYWQLSELKALPTETRNYIPKIIAAAIIDKNPEDYGFTYYEPQARLPLRLVRVPSPTKLSDLAQLFAITDATIKSHNPQLLGATTPPHADHYQIWVPSDIKIPEASAFTTLARTRIYAEQKTTHGLKIKARGKGVKKYMVKQGDNLLSIAKRFGVSTHELKKLNGLDSNRLYVGQVLRLSPTSG